MLKRVSMLTLAVFFVAGVSVVRAQQPTPSPKQVKASAKKAAAPDESDPLAEVRRITAVSLVNTLADDARMFRDPLLRARVQARAADALWDTERERAVLLFRRAWDEAESADAETDRKLEEEKQRQIREHGFSSIQLPPSIRTEVLRLAAKRDRSLGEEFLLKMEEARKREAENAVTSNERPTNPAENNSRPDPTEAPPAVAKRLRLAVQLLEDGDVERAIQFADPALGAVNIPALEFLARLRVKNAKAADERYAALLARAAADPASDPNTISLLSSYIFTPSLYVTFSDNAGSSSNSWSRNFAPPTDLSPQLRAAFFRAASAVLLRPTPTPDQDRTSTGRAGWYMVIARMLPLFEQFLPDRSAALRAKMASLASDTPERVRQPGNNALSEGLVPEDPNRDRIQDTLRRLDGAKTSEERDLVYADAVMDAVRRKDPRAEELLNKIEDTDLRKRLRAFLDYEAARAAVNDKDTAAALKLARGDTMTPIQRAWTFTEVARLLSKSEPGRAAEILDEALADARDHIDGASAERVRALVAVATQMIQLDRARTWEVMLEVVKASNAAKDFTGEDARMGVRLQTKNGVSASSTNVQSFDLNDIFAKLAAEDLSRAVELAKAFDGESPRAIATLAVARYVLSKGGKL
ncbi:MAG TPA: hypothetical protein VGP08_04015 [Pyrinomonadaceae bacterium]|nr:hypothetical protein [Pyrinomonadaceae bacterium]